MSPTLWEALQTGCHKLNFDGASKGNPGPTRYRAVIHNNKGEILHIVVENLGHNNNNATYKQPKNKIFSSSLQKVIRKFSSISFVISLMGQTQRKIPQDGDL
jgi:hypothetical protein